MVTLQKLQSSQYPKIYPLLQRHDPTLSKDQWRCLFDYRWAKEPDFCGYGLFDQDKPVGFLGLIFSQRWIAGQLEPFCNLSTWFVLEPYRGHSLSLLLPILRRQDLTFTDLSPADVVIKIAGRFGFQRLDQKITLLWAPKFLIPRSPRSVLLLTPDSAALSQLVPEHQRILKDHQPYPHCRHLLLLEKGRSPDGEQLPYCYVVYTVVDQATPRYCYIQYISNRDLFHRHSMAIRRAIAHESHTPFILLDARFTALQRPPYSLELPLKFTKLYRSSRLRPIAIDNLYSEFTLLNFSVLPKTLKELGVELRTYSRRTQSTQD